MRRLLTALALALLAVAPAAAEDGEEAFTLTLDVVNRYVWRGYDLSHTDPTALATLEWAPAGGRGFWLSAGFILGFENNGRLGDDVTDVDEVDFAAGWEGELAEGRLTAGVAFYYYGYTSDWTREIAYGDDYDTEVNAYLSWNEVEHFVPSINYYYGLDDGIEGSYIELGLAFPWEWERASTEPKVVGGWSSQYEVGQRMTHVTATLPVSIEVGPTTVTPSISYTWVDDPEGFNPEEIVGERPREGIFWFGMQLAWTF